MLVLREDAVVTSIAGIQVYQFGLCAAIGALLAVLMLVILNKVKKQVPGAAALQSVLCLACGFILSRVLFGLLDASLGQVMPVWAMLRLNVGGYSLYGALAGACVGMWLAAKILRQRPAVFLDLLAPAFLAFVICERAGESCIDGFGWSRGIKSEFLHQPWLAVVDDYGSWYLMTWRLEIAIAAILLVILLIDVLKPHKAGHTFLKFMMLFGATQIIMESMRYDQHMTVRSFVRMEQIFSMVLLGVAVIILAVRQWNRHRGLALAGLISIPVVTAAAVAIEFAIDRTDISRLLLYAVFIILVAVPAALGFRLLKEDRA